MRCDLPIDYSQIDFPSDHVTLKRLRALTPQGRGLEFAFEDEGASLDGMHFMERQLARAAFVTEASDKEQIQRTMRDIERLSDLVDDRQELARQYIRYGIADGPETAQQLIRRLEASAGAQAREKLGKTSP
jgi:hypothetical protein